MFRPRLAAAACCAAVAAVSVAAPAAGAADPKSPQVKQTIDRGVEFLRSKNKSGAADAYFFLSALAIAKGGPKDDPIVKKAVEAIREQTKGGEYKAPRHHAYEAGVCMMLLDAAGDPETDKPAMQAMLDYVLKVQRPHGGWYYPNAPANEFGDTSITQYALLGLWSAERFGLDVPETAWARVGQWQLVTRQKGGGFAYQPKRGGGGDVRITMTAAGACDLFLTARYLHGASATEAIARRRAREEEQARAAAAARELDRKYAGLERRLPPEEQASADEQGRAAAAVPLQNLMTGAEGAINFLTARFQLGGQHPLYFLYTVERLGALSARRQFGPIDWYDVGSNYLIQKQKKDGSWDGEGSPEAGTAFAVMFLSLSTAKAIGRDLYGAGLLAGGRGLPDDLSRASFDGSKIDFEEEKQPVGDLADLLTSLEDPRAADVPAAREAVLETVRVGDREALVGQTERLRGLIDDPRPEVRAVVCWALARSGGPSDVAALFERLRDDPSPAVAQEAHNALCVLARLPRGPAIPLAIDDEAEQALRDVADRDLPSTYFENDRLRVVPPGPFDGFDALAGEEERAAAFRRWQTVAVAAWEDWRDAVRPYDQRDRTPAPKLR